MFIEKASVLVLLLVAASAWQSMVQRSRIQFVKMAASKDDDNSFMNVLKKSIKTERDRVLSSNDLPTTKDISELPASFDDAVTRAANRVVAAMQYGNSKLRIDFDTSIGL